MKIEKRALTLLNISNFFLFFLIFSINVNAPDFYYTKEIFFILFISVSLTYGDFSRTSEFLLIITIYLLSLSFNLFFEGSNVTAVSGLKNIPGLLYLTLLVYNTSSFKRVIISSYLISAMITSLLIISIWIVCFVSDPIRESLVNYFMTVKSDKVAFIFMIRERKILDWWIPGVYYGTVPCVIPALGYSLARLLDKKSLKYSVISFVYMLALIFTGSRANILTTILLLFCFIFFRFFLDKKYVTSLAILFFTLYIALFLSISFLTDEKESSLAVKKLHQISYEKLFKSDIFRTTFIGWGAGSTFFTEGYNRYTNLTELSLFETIRRYGIIPTLAILFFIWFKPLFLIISKSFSIKHAFLFIVVLAYIFVAFTNPFLIGSIGFTALLFFSVIIERGLDLKKL